MKKILILVVLASTAFLSFYYLGISTLQKSREEKLKRDELIFNLFSWQLQTLNELGNEISELQKEIGVEKKKNLETSGRLAEEKLRYSTEQEQTQKQLSELARGVSEAKPYDLANIINQWRPRITHVECEWQNALGNPDFFKTGSGILTEDSNGSYILTNKHVVLDGINIPTICRIQFPNSTDFISVAPDNIKKAASGDDWAQIYIPSTEKISSLISSKLNICHQIPLLGSNMVILGYPAIGAKTDITATEGIISGYDGNYLITSAKVDLGNSGGAAVWLKNNCYLGITSYTKTGAAESLARILKAEIIFLK